MGFSTEFIQLLVRHATLTKINGAVNAAPAAPLSMPLKFKVKDFELSPLPFLSHF